MQSPYEWFNGWGGLGGRINSVPSPWRYLIALGAGLAIGSGSVLIMAYFARL